MTWNRSPAAEAISAAAAAAEKQNAASLEVLERSRGGVRQIAKAYCDLAVTFKEGERRLWKDFRANFHN